MKIDKEKVITFVKTPKIWISFCIILITIVSSISLLQNGIIYGHDIRYHLTRIEGIAENLKQGNIFSLFHYNIKGYGNGLFYPQIFLYIPAILNLCGIDLAIAYKIFLIICNLATAIIMYLCTKSITKDKVIAITAAALYTTCNYRMVCLIERAALGELQAFIFIPIVILGLYEVFYRDSKKWYILTIGIVGLVYTHLISVVIVVIFLCFPIFLINIKNIFKEKERFKYLLYAVLITILLTAAFIFPFLEQILNYKIYLNTYETSIKLTDRINGFISSICSIEMYITDREVLIPGVGLIIVIFSSIYFIKKEKKEYTNLYKSLYIIAFILLILMSAKFIWKYLKFLNYIQFPWRFQIINSAIYCLLSSTMLWKIIRKFNKEIVNILMVLIILLSTVLIPMLQNARWNNTLDFNEINKIGLIYGGGEYLPYNITLDKAKNENFEYRTNNSDIKLNIEYDKGKYIIEYSENMKNSYIELPIYYYGGYEIVESDNETDYISFEYGYVRINVTNNEGKIMLKYKYTFIQKISYLITAISYFILIIQIIKLKGQKND